MSEMELDIKLDRRTGLWRVTTETITENEKKILDAIRELGPNGPTRIGEVVDRHKGAVLKDLEKLEQKGMVYKDKNANWHLSDE